MARAWLVTSRGIAKKIKNTAPVSNNQINEISAEANLECPNCYHVIDNSDVNLEWPGFPTGVKFDPLDIELIEHLEAKVGLGNSKPHLFIDDFIPTLDEEHGICYTHPQNLPGVHKDGSSSHFFHKISNAYSSGPRKRRKINNGLSSTEVRWHKTGKTKPIIDQKTGIQKGWKKIMVLYMSTKRGSKPDKANWVMHQYHIGSEEDEKDGQLVVSKIIYQFNAGKDKENELGKDNDNNKFELDSLPSVGPSTPVTNAPQPPRQNKRKAQVIIEDEKVECEGEVICLKDEGESSAAWWAAESHAIEDPVGIKLDQSHRKSKKNIKLDQSLHCNEVLDSFATEPFLHFDFGLDAYGLSEFNNVDLGSPPDPQLADLQFGSQDSISSWIDRV